MFGFQERVLASNNPNALFSWIGSKRRVLIMASRGSIFKTGDYLHPGDALVSANGLYCAYLFEDDHRDLHSFPTPRFSDLGRLLPSASLGQEVQETSADLDPELTDQLEKLGYIIK